MKPILRLRRVQWLPLAMLFLARASYGEDADYRQSVEQWRRHYQEELTSDTGWLTVSGLFWLHEGLNSFGSDPANEIVLPTPAPPRAGTFEFRAGRTTVHVNPGVNATIKGKPVQTADLRPDSVEDRIVLGYLTLYVHASGNRFAIRMKDKNSKLRSEFTSLNWYPIDETYHVTARFVPYDPPRERDSQNVLGDPIKMDLAGYLEFSLRGRKFRLEVEPGDNGGFFVVFRDLTAGRETYPASRFIDTEAPKDEPGGKSVELDFNKAYNPPCAYNPYTTCPLPLPGNRLNIPIRAGEKLYRKHER